MNFGFVSLDTFVGPPTSNPSELGSTNVKQHRSVSDPNIEDQQQHWRASKVPKTMSSTQDMVMSPILRSDQMLSFSSNKSEPTFPYYQRNMPRYSSGYGASGNMQMGLNNRGQIFTASQWIELEHQALIYKYLTSNVPVPSNLLLPLKKSFVNNPFGFTSSNNIVSSLPHNSFGFGWGSFQMGYGDNSDPEPGRCRRTDGKKWRCSRDAVVDQKYCDKHINRGRHRSRKPVEGQLQTGQASSAPAVVKPPPPPSGRHSNADSALVVNRISSSPTTVDPKQEPGFGLISAVDNNNNNNYYNYNNNSSTGRSNVSWAHEAQPEWTQLSMALPVSPLRLSQRQEDWVPLSWGPLGGPLGEALTNNTSSPTGVLHKSTFCSLSNSSAGSSPRTADHQNANAK